MRKLFIGPAGVPQDAPWKTYPETIKNLSKEGLDVIEIELVRGAKMRKEKIEDIRKAAQKHHVVLTVHAPYYINLNASEKAKRERSKERILQSARVAQVLEAYSIVFHPGFYLGNDPETVYKRVEKELKDVIKQSQNEGIDVWIRPELMGKITQFGSLQEIVKLSENIEGVLPTIDFAHAHARSNGECNTREEWEKMLLYMEEHLGRIALDEMHIHVSDIEYNERGEKKHLPLDTNSFQWRELIRVLKDYRVAGVLICESPQMHYDALKILEHWKKRK